MRHLFSLEDGIKLSEGLGQGSKSLASRELVRLFGDAAVKHGHSPSIADR